ncbi:WXG100 family type VII secretion target [Rhodococcus sp. NPDC049939]|uniref:WXG100 family type VII secretion target n=1 Tax=Rhodococcus sp. NPDC049939 TaxID=3155511 RepID=UPI0034029EFC
MKYGFAELQSLASDIRSNESALRETHDELQSYVQGLVSQWNGEAQISYQEVQSRWDRSHDDLLQTLQQIAKVVEQGANDMLAAEQRNAATWQQ